ncbi:hypothetical protein F5B20DRAFT_583668 [Whalleya microplaca]|nr:hypothetical protein F5B20DRAFT_583668 [Whalleya microplaca]
MPRINGLEVYTDETGQHELLAPASIRYRILESVIHLGLSILECPQGRDSLVHIAAMVIELRSNPTKGKPIPHVYNRPLDEMPQWIDRFLRSLKANFPTVYLRVCLGEASAVKYNWGDDMAKYNPKVAGHLNVQRSIINNMAYVHGQPPDIARDNYKLFKYQMGITIAHEIVHLLTGYLTGTARPLTPPRVSLTAYGKSKAGESGRYWESTMLGGVVEFWEDITDPLKERQAGKPYLIKDGRNNVPAKLISMNYINNLLHGNFSFPVVTSTSSGASTTRGALRQGGREMTTVRKRWDAPTYTSPPRGESPASSTTSYRRLPTTSSIYATQSHNGRHGTPEYASSWRDLLKRFWHWSGFRNIKPTN